MATTGREWRQRHSLTHQPVVGGRGQGANQLPRVCPIGPGELQFLAELARLQPWKSPGFDLDGDGVLGGLPRRIGGYDC